MIRTALQTIRLVVQ